MLKKIIFNFKIKYLKPNLTKIDNVNISNLYSQNLGEINFTKRKALVKHALQYSNFYKNRYADLIVSELKNEIDFNQLPILTRNDIKNNFKEIISSNINPKNYPKVTTSGSTGTSITVLHDNRDSHAPTQWRILKWWGISPYDNKAFIYRYPKTIFENVINAILWWPTKRIFLWGSEMNETKIRKFVTSFNKLKPTLLQGYNDVMFEFALFLKDHDLKIHPPKAVWVTAAPLISQQRIIMQQVFGAPVYDQYGCSEIPYVSAECQEQEGLHIMQDLVHVECVDEDNKQLPPNTWGKILITDLHNYAFPLIRYETGDYGRLLDYKCSCGINLPLMDNVSGRESDIIKTPTEIKIYGNFLTSLFDKYPDTIRAFQIIQRKDYSVELCYVPMNKSKAEEVISAVVLQLKNVVNSEIEITPIKVDKIPKNQGKTKLIVNEL